MDEAEQAIAREAVARWMIEHSYATGHGDTLDDLMRELVAHIADREAQSRHGRIQVMTDKRYTAKELADQARLLIGLNEPEALVEALRRECQRKADSLGEGGALSIQPEEAKRWRTAASALSEAIDTVTASQEPAAASNEPGEPNPPAHQP